MSKIIEKIKSQVQESKDLETLNATLPYTTIYDMLHQFTKDKKSTEVKNMSVFCKAVESCNKTPFEYKDYNNNSTKAKIISHAELYKALFAIYMQYIPYSLVQ